MKKIKYLFLALISLIFVSCSALDALLPQTSTEEISLVNTGENRYKFVVNYNPKKVKNVFLSNVEIQSGVPYYVKEGKYWFRYDDIDKYRITLALSGSRGGGEDDDFDAPEDRSYQFVKRIWMNEDKVLNIEGKNSRVRFVVGKGFK